MKRIIYILILLLVGFTAIAQETPPSGLKAINAQFYIHLPDSSIWQQKGSPYGWHRVGKYKDLLAMDTSLLIHNKTYPDYESKNISIYGSGISSGIDDLSHGWSSVGPTQSATLLPQGVLIQSLTSGLQLLNVNATSSGVQISAPASNKIDFVGAKVTNNITPVGPSDMVRLQDIGGIIPANGFATLITDTTTYLYRRTSWIDFNDFVAQGSYTLSNGNIHITPGQSDALSVNRVTGLQKNILSYTYKATNGLSNAAGPRLGYLSANNTAVLGFQFWFDESTRKINLFDLVSSTTYVGTAVLPAYTPGDIINIKYQNVGYNSGTITVTNQTTGASISFVKQNKYVNPSAPNGSYNSSWITVTPQNTSVAYDIIAIEYSTPFKPGGNLFVGDSIDVGSASSVLPGGYAYQLLGQIDAGPGDKSREVLLRLPEIISLKPEVVYLKIGTNDTSLPTWQANITTIVSSLRRAGIKVILLTPPPMNSTNKQPYRDSLFAMYPTSTIDLFTPLKATSGTGYNPTYDSGDGVHPNQAGHNLIAATIQASPLWHTAVYNKVIDTAILAKRLTNTQVIPGWYSGLSAFNLRADGRINNITTAAQTNTGLVYNNNGVLATDSHVTLNNANGKITSTSTIQAITFSGATTLSLTTQGANTGNFFTQSLVNRVGQFFDSGGWSFVKGGVGADPGIHNYVFDGSVHTLTDNSYSSGTAAFRWSTVYGVNGIFNTNVQTGGITAFTNVTSDIGSTSVNFNNIYANRLQSNANAVIRMGSTGNNITLGATGGTDFARWFGNGHAMLNVSGSPTFADNGYALEIVGGTTKFGGNITLNQTGATTGDLLYYGTGGVLNQIPDIAVNNALLTNGVGGIPFYGKITYSHTDATTIAPIASPNFTGIPVAPTPGANISTTQIPTTAWVNTYFMTNPLTTTGDIIISTSGATPSRLGIGSSGQVLTVSGGVPVWSTPSSGFTNPMTTQNDIIYGGSSGAATRLAIGAAGQVLTSNGASTPPSWQTPSAGSGTVSRLQSFYNSVIPGSSVADIYSYTVPGNSLVSNGAILNVSYEGVMTAGATYQFELFFAGTSLFSQGSTATTGTNDQISINFKIYKTGTSTAIVIGKVSTGTGAVTTQRISIGLTGLDFTTGNIVKIAGAGTLSSFAMNTGDIIAYQ